MPLEFSELVEVGKKGTTVTGWGVLEYVSAEQRVILLWSGLLLQE